MNSGYKGLSDEYECKIASEKLGFEFDATYPDNENLPAGCQIYNSSLTKHFVYWNNHRTGRSDSGASIICKDCVEK